MLATPALLLLCALAGADDVVLLDFSASWCGPCQAMNPIVARMQQAGLPVRKVDVDAERGLAQQFRVTNLPCFVVVAGGREVERVVGMQSYERLAQMIARARPAANAPTQLMADHSRVQPVEETALSAARPAAAPGGPTAVERAMAATVRLKVEDPKSYSFGTGTIIDTHGQEGLVVTCGHIFRDSQGSGRIQIDLFAPGGPAHATGQLVHHDLERDIALVAIRADAPLAAVQVAGPGHQNERGDRVFSIGCNKGSAPTVIEGRVLSTANCHITTSAKEQIPLLEVSGRPIEGRSGGGLFTADGRLIGVCNFADQDEDKGFYANTQVVQGELDRNKLSFVYRGGGAAVNHIAAAGPAAAPSANLTASAAPAPIMPATLPASFSLPAASAAPARPQPLPAGDMEVICIVRSRQNPGASNVIVVQQPSAALLDSLSREARGGSMMAGPPAAGAFPAPTAFQPGTTLPPAGPR